MMKYIKKVKELFKSFEGYTITQVSREENSKADAFARLASATDMSLTKLIPIKFLSIPSIYQKEIAKLIFSIWVKVRWILSLTI